jgi:predicted site-specific integrase-resolvase
VTVNDEWDSLLEQLAGHELGDGWVSLSEAALASGVSLSTLRSWYRSGKVASRMVPGVHGPERRVRLDEVADRSSRSARLSRQWQATVATEAVLADLLARVAAIEARLGLGSPT